MSCYVSLKLGKQLQRPLPSQSQAAARLVRALQGAGERPAAGVDGERVAAGVRGERTAAGVGGATGVGIAVAGAVGQIDEDEKEGAEVEANGVESVRSLAAEAPTHPSSNPTQPSPNPAPTQSSLPHLIQTTSPNQTQP